MKQKTMIEQLRRRVFRGILLSSAGVLLVILVAWNVLNGVQRVQRLNRSIKEAEMFLDGFSMPHEKEYDGNYPMKKRMGEKPPLPPALSDGELMIWEIDSEGNRILLNAPSVRTQILETAGWSLLAFFAACILFALMAKIIADRIVAPVEESVKSQKRFIADASHELKTPLTVIDANISVLEKDIGSSKWLDYIKEQTSRMAALVTALLTLSKADETGGAAAQDIHTDFDAAEALMECTLPFESAAYEQGLTLRTEAPDTLPFSGNAEDFKEITGILIDNACKHAGPGGEIVVALKDGRLLRKNRTETALVLSVANTGETIPEDVLPHIFERFYRADASRTHTDNSFGLGLAIAKALTEKNGGDISVTSRDGRTEFTVSLGRR